MGGGDKTARAGRRPATRTLNESARAREPAVTLGRPGPERPKAGEGQAANRTPSHRPAGGGGKALGRVPAVAGHHRPAGPGRYAVCTRAQRLPATRRRPGTEQRSKGLPRERAGRSLEARSSAGVSGGPDTGAPSKGRWRGTARAARFARQDRRRTTSDSPRSTIAGMRPRHLGRPPPPQLPSGWPIGRAAYFPLSSSSGRSSSSSSSSPTPAPSPSSPPPPPPPMPAIICCSIAISMPPPPGPPPKPARRSRLRRGKERKNTAGYQGAEHQSESGFSKHSLRRT